MRNMFRDPTGERDDWEWPINHTEEDEVGKVRNVEHGANTANNAFVRQQSDETPMILRYQGIALTRAQVRNFLVWWKDCKDHTVLFRDFAGDWQEVIITEFKATRHYTVSNPRDKENAPQWYWRYAIAMDVVAIRDEDATWYGVTP